MNLKETAAAWSAYVLRGYYGYHAVPGNSDALLPENWRGAAAAFMPVLVAL